MAVGGNQGGAGGAKNIAKAQKPKRIIKAAPPPPKPVPQTPKAARTQERAYASQGRSVEKQAQAQKKVVRARQRQGDTKGDMGRGRAESNKAIQQSTIKTVDKVLKHQNPAPETAAKLTKQGLIYKHRGIYYPSNDYSAIKKAQAPGAAPALKILEQTTRGLHATAGAARETIKGGNAQDVAKEFAKGAANKTKYTGSDVLEAAGIHNKAVKGVGGFALDIPLSTLPTFGAGSVAEREAVRAGEKAAKAARQAGLSTAGVESAARGAVRKVNPEAASQMKVGTRKTSSVGVTQGVKKSTAKKVVQEDIKQAVKRTEHNPPKGLVVKVAGKEIPGVRKASSVASKPLRAIGGKIPGRGRLRTAGHEFRPFVRPDKQVPIHEFIAGRQAKSQNRVIRHMHERRGEEESIHLTKEKLSPDEWEQVFAAVERGPRAVRKFSQRPATAHLGDIAKSVQSHYKGQLRQRRQAGAQVGAIGPASVRRLGEIPRPGVPLSRSEPGEELKRLARGGKGHGSAKDVLAAMDRVEKALAERERRTGAPGYVPHMQKSTIEEGTAGEVPKKASKNVGSAKYRQFREPIDVLNPQREQAGKSQFSTSGPLVHHNYAIQTGRVLGRHAQIETLVEAGRPLKAKTKVTEAKWKDGVKIKEAKVKRVWEPANLKPGEALYEVTRKKGIYDIREVPAPKSMRSSKAVKYVVLNKKNAETAIKPLPTVQGMLKEHGQYGEAGSAVIGGFDKATRGFKILATGTPGFHVRNLIGDTHMHYNLAPGHKMPSNYSKALKVTAALSKSEVKRKIGVPEFENTDKIMFAGKMTPVMDVYREAEKAGVPRSGQRAIDVKLTTSELEGRSGVTKEAGLRRRGGAKISRWMQNREDLSRLATYIHLRDQGHTPKEAARILHEGPHPDYGDLSFIEREVGRRVAPFYTFSARALPYHAKTLVQRPSKVARFEAAIEETQKAAGGGAAALGASAYTQRNLPILVSSGGKKFNVQWSDPTNLLNELPTTLDPIDYVKEVGNFGMGLTTPIVKDPVEYINNYSFFFRSEIEPDNSPLTRAPKWVAGIPASERAKLRIGKRKSDGQWMWPKKLDYLTKLLPGVGQQAESIATPGGSSSTEGKILSFVTGIRPTKYDPKAIKINALFATDNEILKKQTEMRKLDPQNYKADPKYQELLAKERAVSHEINKLSGGKYKTKSTETPAKQGPVDLGGGQEQQGIDLGAPSHHEGEIDLGS